MLHPAAQPILWPARTLARTGQAARGPQFLAAVSGAASTCAHALRARGACLTSEGRQCDLLPATPDGPHFSQRSSGEEAAFTRFYCRCHERAASVHGGLDLLFPNDEARWPSFHSFLAIRLSSLEKRLSTFLTRV